MKLNNTHRLLKKIPSPIGTKLKVIQTGDIVTLEEIRNFPTRFKIRTASGDIKYYKTFEVEVMNTND